MKITIITIISLVVLLMGFQQVRSMDKKMDGTMVSGAAAAGTREAVFAGGCFWCTESDFEKVDGVIEAVSGYTGGHVKSPAYEQVSSGGTGHVESVKVIYDPQKVTYQQLLEVFWREVNPTDAGGQFVDRGDQYRSVIFYADQDQRLQAEASKKKLAGSGVFKNPIVTEILPLGDFYPAEDYHQDYYKKNPIRYHWYRSGSGRDQFLEKTWAGRPVQMKETMMETKDAMPMKDERNDAMSNSAYTIADDAELRKRLTPQQYHVVRENGTEQPFANAYWDNHEAGIYVDIVSLEPLFSSTDKFDSGTGWPSFTKPLEADNIVEKTDKSFFTVRTEVRSRHADSHLGHVFDDGPAPTGLRYCINSAALDFVPKSELKARGLEQYLRLFKDEAMTHGKSE